MHLTHALDDLLLIAHIVCKRESWTWRYFILISFALMHVAKIHVTHLVSHPVVHLHSKSNYLLKGCTLVGGAYVCYVFLKALIHFMLYSYLNLWCMLSSITKKGEIESTFAPLVVSVIHVNVHVVGLTLSSSLFQESSTLASQGHVNVDPSKC